MLYFPRLYFMQLLVDKLEHWCTFLHHDPIIALEIKITGRHCNLAMWAIQLDEKYHLGKWRKPNPNNPLDRKRMPNADS